MSLMYQPPLAPTPSLVFSLVRIKSGMTGEAVIWMDSAGSTQTSMPAAFAGVDVATVFRGIGEWSPVTCFFFFLVRRSHSIIFTRAQGIPKYKIGFGRGRGWESWEGLVEGVSSPCGLVVPMHDGVSCASRPSFAESFSPNATELEVRSVPHFGSIAA
jgi:hypothetical protein